MGEETNEQELYHAQLEELYNQELEVGALEANPAEKRPAADDVMEELGRKTGQTG